MNGSDNIENPQILLEADELAGLTGESTEVIIEEIEKGEDIEEKLREERDNKISQIYMGLKSRGVLKEIGGSDNE